MWRGVMPSAMQGETGANPVRARRREVHQSARFYREPHPETSHWRDPRRWDESVPSRNIRRQKNAPK